MTTKLVYEMENRGVPAFGPVWDSWMGGGAWLEIEVMYSMYAVAGKLGLEKELALFVL